MIVDCHTHIWQTPEQLGQLDLGESSRPAARVRVASFAGATGAAAKMLPNKAGSTWRSVPAADSEHHLAQTAAVDKSFVLGFKSRYMQAEIPNRYVADYVARFPNRLIGFAGIDPTEPAALDELQIAHDDLKLRGITLSPASQDFHPADTRAMRVYEAAERLKMPIVVHPVGRFTEQSKLEFARPYLLDEVARSFPSLRLVVAQLGQPWVDETVVLLAKHQHVYADISGMLARPWQAYNAMVTAHQAGVSDKLLFGSDFPYTSVADCIEALYNINQFAHGTNLPLVPRESLRGIVERDAVGLLGLA